MAEATPQSMSVMEAPPGPETVVDGRPCLYFGGTGYFGLHARPELREAGVDAWKRFGLSSATSRLANPLQVSIERAAARFFATEDAAYLASGYLTNTALPADDVRPRVLLRHSSPGADQEREQGYRAATSLNGHASPPFLADGRRKPRRPHDWLSVHRRQAPTPVPRPRPARTAGSSLCQHRARTH